jgi:hypothetical protein
MHWLLLLLAVGALAVALTTSSMGLAAICVLAALALLVGWVLGWYSARVGARSRDESAMVDPAEMRRLRELAEARKAASQAPPPAGP